MFYSRIKVTMVFFFFDISPQFVSIFNFHRPQGQHNIGFLLSLAREPGKLSISKLGPDRGPDGTTGGPLRLLCLRTHNKQTIMKNFQNFKRVGLTSE